MEMETIIWSRGQRGLYKYLNGTVGLHGLDQTQATKRRIVYYYEIRDR